MKILALKLTPQEKIELEVIHISIKMDVSCWLKTQQHRHLALLGGLILTTLRMLGDLIAGSLREVSYSEMFKKYSKML